MDVVEDYVLEMVVVSVQAGSVITVAPMHMPVDFMLTAALFKH
jgi:hypothetical protein